MKILLVEDDFDDRDFFLSFLGMRSDIEILPMVTGGEELFAYLKDTRNSGKFPDAIIIDQNMPRITGLQVLEGLKLHPEYTSIPAIIYSNYIDEKLQTNGKALGATNVFLKPCNAEGYGEMIEELKRNVEVTKYAKAG